MEDKIYTSSEIEEKYGINKELLSKYCRTNYIKTVSWDELPLEYVKNHYVRKNGVYITESEIKRFLVYKASGGQLGNRTEIRFSSDNIDLQGIIRNRYNPIIVSDNGVYDIIPKDLLQRICVINLVDFREELS